MKSVFFSYLKIPSLEPEETLRDLREIPDRCWFYDPYRTVSMLPIYTDSGKTDKVGSLNQGREKMWTSYANKQLKKYLQKYIFNWMNPFGRVMVLRTPGGGKSKTHIDCRLEDFKTPQYKLRIVLQGHVSSLYFITCRGFLNPETDRVGVPFIIDGRWPHGVNNESDNFKYTLCIGSPWAGFGLDDGLIDKSDSYSWDNYQLPSNYEAYFESPEERMRKFL